MGRKSFVRRAPHSTEMSLQITSLADVFVIILVFFLKAYASGTVEVNPSAGMKLPVAHRSDAGVKALKVEVSEKAVLVEGQVVAEMVNYAFAGSDLASGTSKSLVKALEKERAREELILNSPTTSANNSPTGSGNGLVSAAGSNVRPAQAAGVAAPGAMAPANPERETRIIVIADQRVPYSTIKAVLASAATEGYTDFKLAVANE